MSDLNYYKLTINRSGCSRRLETSIFDMLKKVVKNVLWKVIYSLQLISANIIIRIHEKDLCYENYQRLYLSRLL